MTDLKNPPKGGFVIVSGQEVSVDEAKQLLRMFMKDAEKIAGEFHDMERSEKFRVNWPDQYKYAAACWKSHIEDCRKMYAGLLGDPKTSPENKRRIHLAIVLWDMIAKGQEQDTRLQLFRGTQQFEGDPYENRKIAEQFGNTPNLRAWLKNSTATRH